MTSKRRPNNIAIPRQPGRHVPLPHAHQALPPGDR
jgi:hypothetical protein